MKKTFMLLGLLLNHSSIHSSVAHTTTQLSEKKQMLELIRTLYRGKIEEVSSARRQGNPSPKRIQTEGLFLSIMIDCINTHQFSFEKLHDLLDFSKQTLVKQSSLNKEEVGKILETLLQKITLQTSELVAKK